MLKYVFALLAAALLVTLLAVLGVGAALPIVDSRTAATGPAPALTTTPEATEPPTTPSPAATAAPTALPATATPTAAAPAIQSPPATASERAARWGAIVEQYLGDLPGEFGVVVKDLKTGEAYVANGDRPFPTASLYKLWLMYEVLKQAAEGKIDLDTKMTVEPRHMSQSEFDEKLPLGLSLTIDRSLWFLITLSSNSAAMALHDYVEWSDINASLRQLGFTQSHMAGDPGAPAFGDWRDETSSSTPNEILRFFELIYNKELLSAEASEKMMWLLRNQQMHDRLSKRLPAGVVMAHKTGNLPGVINNAGIIFGPRTDLYIGVMSQGADYELTTKALQDLGLALYQATN